MKYKYEGAMRGHATTRPLSHYEMSILFTRYLVLPVLFYIPIDGLS